MINLDFLPGYKTYIVAFLIGVVAFCQYSGFIDMATAQLLYGILGATGTATVAAKINRNA